MVIVKPAFEDLVHTLLFHLHSSMVIVKQHITNHIFILQFYLHSSMVIVKLGFASSSVEQYKFTFQYGYSKTGNNSLTLNIVANLHSSMVIVKLFSLVLLPLLQLYLHSSMVIVKPGQAQLSTFQLTGFTFQYGYSKTFNKRFELVRLGLFTFQYGYSKTKTTKKL